MAILVLVRVREPAPDEVPFQKEKYEYGTVDNTHGHHGYGTLTSCTCYSTGTVRVATTYRAGRRMAVWPGGR